MNDAFKVVHGDPSDEELAAVVAVLLSAGQQSHEPAADRGDGVNRPTSGVSWSRGSRTYAAPAASWKFLS
ncbi:acyl-CoA carboxylase subunit epsilon [Streptomyces sp. NPDC058252]|uniref:acyl-CoA carboxylase subunit epsilon n=1 Tax=Streptomyces sp. NPDC058252 TaxID=3346405 RepID=UPI0036ED7D06